MLVLARPGPSIVLGPPVVPPSENEMGVSSQWGKGCGEGVWGFNRTSEAFT